MKSLLRAVAASLFAALSRAVIRKYHPTVVMVTGSVGKTSTKDAVAAALSPRFHLRASEKSYNSEFGVPLTILGSENPWDDLLAWFRVLGDALSLLVFPNHYPKLLVLEVGADRPGDLQHILEIATPDAVVVTKLPDVPVHVEAYASPADLRLEEFAPALMLRPGAPLVVCADDAYATELAGRILARVSTYGFSEGADVRIVNPETLIEEKLFKGMRADLAIGSERSETIVRGALGRQQLYAPAAALALAEALGMGAEEALNGLTAYVPPPGRARLLEGKNHSVIIDDTYNASPAAAEEVLRSLELIPGVKRRVAILGDMLELGRFSRAEHERLGKRAAECVDVVIGVGTRATAIVEAAKAAGKGEKEALHFASAAEAAEALRDFPRAADLLLVKGSQGMRMERVVASLLRDPSDVTLLVRQEKEWKKRA